MGDTKRGVKNIIHVSTDATTKLFDKIQARDDVPRCARNLMDNVDRNLKKGADRAERALDRGGKKKSSHSHSKNHSSKHSTSSKRPPGLKRPSKHSKSSTKPPKGYPKPPPGYPGTKPTKPSKYSVPPPSGLSLHETIVQKLMDPRLQATVEKGEMFIRKKLAKKLSPREPS